MLLMIFVKYTFTVVQYFIYTVGEAVEASQLYFSARGMPQIA